ncbi:MAG: hypothetical protein ACJ77W_06640, partial [Chloroflexota bacterium]
MSTLATDAAVVTRAARLRGELRLPGDKSISHRALMLATIATGASRIEGAGDGADVRSTAAACAALGAGVERIEPAAGARNVDYRVVSAGVDGLHAPAADVDCGNSGTSRSCGSWWARCCRCARACRTAPTRRRSSS